MFPEMSFGARQRLANLLGKLGGAALGAALAPPLKLHPVIGAVAGVVIHEMVEPRITNAMLAAGL